MIAGQRITYWPVNDTMYHVNLFGPKRATMGAEFSMSEYGDFTSFKSRGRKGGSINGDDYDQKLLKITTSVLRLLVKLPSWGF